MKKWIVAGMLLAGVMSASGQDTSNDLIAEIDHTQKELVILFQHPVPEEQGVLTIYKPSGALLLQQEVELIEGTPFFRASFTTWPLGMYTAELQADGQSYSLEFSL
jgi:hypothetical protein